MPILIVTTMDEDNQGFYVTNVHVLNYEGSKEKLLADVEPAIKRYREARSEWSSRERAIRDANEVLRKLRKRYGKFDALRPHQVEEIEAAKVNIRRAEENRIVEPELEPALVNTGRRLDSLLGDLFDPEARAMAVRLGREDMLPRVETLEEWLQNKVLEQTAR